MNHCVCWDSGSVCCYCDWEHEGDCTNDLDSCLAAVSTEDTDDIVTMTTEDTDTYTMVCGVNCGHVGCMTEEETE